MEVFCLFQERKIQCMTMTLKIIVEYRKYAAAEIPQDMLKNQSIRVDEIRSISLHIIPTPR